VAVSRLSSSSVCSVAVAPIVSASVSSRSIGNGTRQIHDSQVGILTRKRHVPPPRTRRGRVRRELSQRVGGRFGPRYRLKLRITDSRRRR
jgi:hypothetical protein